MLMLNEKWFSRMAWMVFTVLAVIVICTFRHYGVTWDEELQSQYGLAVLDYYLSGFKDLQYKDIYNLHLYGGMFDGFAAFVDQFTPYTIYDTRHFLNAFFGLLGLWGTWRLGKFMGGPAVGLVSLVLLALTPMYYGHMFNNPKDIPFAAGIVWTIYYMGRCMAERPRPKVAIIAKLGIILGLTLGVRIGGAMVLLFWGVPVAWDALRILMIRAGEMRIRKAFIALVKEEARMVLPVAILAYAVMLLCWPWAQESPILNPWSALNEFSNFPHDVDVLLDGITYQSSELPWYYVPLYFGVQLPEILLGLLAAFFAGLPWIWRGIDLPRRQTLTLVLLMAFVPVMYAVLRHPALYDAVRHFLFAVPLFCVLAGVAAQFLFVWTVNEFRRPWARYAIASGLLTVFIIAEAGQIVVMTRLHPYEYIYANQFAGGVQGAFGRYEMDYWGSSFKEAAEHLQAYVAKHGGIPAGKIYRLAICGPWDSAMIYLPPDYEPVVADQPAEFFLSTTRWMCQNMRPGRDIIRIERMGVPLSVVKDLRGGYETIPQDK